MKKKLDDEAKDRISYINWIVIGFARGFKRPASEVVKYLDEYGGLQFLFDNYEYEHTQSEIRTHNTLLKVCRNNGGYL